MIRSFISTGRHLTRTQNSLKGYKNLIQCQNLTLTDWKIHNSKLTNFKIQSSGFRNAELGQWMCCVWAESKHSWAFYLQIMEPFSVCLPPVKFWRCYLWQKSLSCPQKHLISITVLWIINRVNSEGALNTNVHHGCKLPVIQLSDTVISPGLGLNRRFIFGLKLKVVLIPVASALPASWLGRMPNPSYCIGQYIPQKQDLWTWVWSIIFNDISFKNVKLGSVDLVSSTEYQCNSA